jgi:hypothetical protein
MNNRLVETKRNKSRSEKSASPVEARAAASHRGFNAWILQANSPRAHLQLRRTQFTAATDLSFRRRAIIHLGNAALSAPEESLIDPAMPLPVADV